MTTLAAILDNAKPGDVIDLFDTPLTGASASTAHAFDPPVTIKNATFRDLVIRNQKGIIFQDCHYVTSKVRNDCQSCENIVHSGGTVREDGLVDNSRGITYRDSKNITVEKLDCRGLQYALIFWRVEGLKLDANVIKQVRTDAMRVQDCKAPVQVIRNYVTDFAQTLSHPDALQLFQQTNRLEGPLIAFNRFYRGNGSLFQGIFIKDEGLKNLISGAVIHDNVVIGSMNNAISIWGDAKVERNLTIGDFFVAAGATKPTTPMIAVSRFTGTLTNNTAAMFSLDGKQVKVPTETNQLVTRMETGAAEAHAADWIYRNEQADKPVDPEQPADSLGAVITDLEAVLARLKALSQ